MVSFAAVCIHVWPALTKEAMVASMLAPLHVIEVQDEELHIDGYPITPEFRRETVADSNGTCYHIN